MPSMFAVPGSAPAGTLHVVPVLVVNNNPVPPVIPFVELLNHNAVELAWPVVAWFDQSIRFVLL